MAYPEPRIIELPRGDYRFLIKPDQHFGLPQIFLQCSYGKRWVRWGRVADKVSWHWLDDQQGLTLKEYVEALMQRLWDEHVKDKADRTEVQAYWDDPDIHADFFPKTKELTAGKINDY